MDSTSKKKKKNNMNTSKRKIIPMRYQKPNLSWSNTSLSQLISIGAYKKRINNLVKNNRLLAEALQEARYENAYHSNMLVEFAKCNNQMKIFKYKINDMAKTTITKLVSDVSDLVKCLEVGWSTDDLNLLQNKGPNDKIKIKAPTVECIAEENEECETASNEMQSEETHNTPEMEPQASSEPEASSANIPDMPPILYIDDSEDHSEEIKKQSSMKSKSRSSSRRHVANGQLSLTPELDIDIDFMGRRQNSSRRQTQVFTPVRSVGRSRKASSIGQTFMEHETPKNSLIRRESIPQRKLSPVLMECDQTSEEDVNKPDDMNINTKARGSKNADVSDLQLSSVNTDDSSANIHNPAVLPLVVSPKKITVNDDANSDGTLANHTILMTEDMELTDVVRPDAGIECGRIPDDIVKAAFNSSDNLHTVRKYVEKEEALSDSKLLAYSEDTEVIPTDEYLDKAEKESRDSIPNVVSPCKNVEPSENAARIDRSPSESPFQRRSSRKRKEVITLKFSTSDSDSDFTPMTPDKKKRIERDTVIYKPLKKSAGENEKKNSLASEKVHKASPSALSVYDLDVSNSKKPVKKSRPRNKPKSSSNKEMAKPLSQKCSITKLKGAECKFSKNENMDFKHKENQQSKISKLQETIPKISQNNADKLKPSIFTCDLGDVVAFESEKSIRASRDEVSSPKVADSREIGFKSPGLRRVSFASTDVVCNFTKMSATKKIVENKKVHRLSKSNFNTFNFGDPEINERKRLTGNINLASGFETENTNLINVLDKNFADFELKLPKEAKVMPTKPKLHTLDEDSTTTDLPALEESNALALDDIVGDLNSKSDKAAASKEKKVEDVASVRHKRIKQKKKDPQPNSGKSCEDISRLSKCPNSPFQYENNNPRKASFQNDLKENVLNNKHNNPHHKHHNRDTAFLIEADPCVKTKKSQLKNIPPTGNFHDKVPGDENVKNLAQTVHKRGISSVEPCQPSTFKKSSNLRLGAESSPVLRDVMNVEENANKRGSSRRGKGAVTYKEPKLNTKMRRD